MKSSCMCLSSLMMRPASSRKTSGDVVFPLARKASIAALPACSNCLARSLASPHILVKLRMKSSLPSASNMTSICCIICAGSVAACWPPPPDGMPMEPAPPPEGQRLTFAWEGESIREACSRMSDSRLRCAGKTLVTALHSCESVVILEATRALSLLLKRWKWAVTLLCRSESASKRSPAAWPLAEGARAQAQHSLSSRPAVIGWDMLGSA
mmetsp:Transcript_111650/g.360414  ORF Transcript_111650/g.360414 Transcript_111650/m.360414 type:complete len:211 (-) Transcript_111650:67-699(-)